MAVASGLLDYLDQGRDGSRGWIGVATNGGIAGDVTGPLESLDALGAFSCADAGPLGQDRCRKPPFFFEEAQNQKVGLVQGEFGRRDGLRWDEGLAAGCGSLLWVPADRGVGRRRWWVQHGASLSLTPDDPTPHPVQRRPARTVPVFHRRFGSSEACRQEN